MFIKKKPIPTFQQTLWLKIKRTWLKIERTLLKYHLDLGFIMAVQINKKVLLFQDLEVYTIKDISELYNRISDIKKFFHFQFKNAESAKNFGSLPESIADTDSHHILVDVESISIEPNNNIRIKPMGQKSDFVLAFTNIPKNYRFDIVNSSAYGKSLVIYNNTGILP